MKWEIEHTFEKPEGIWHTISHDLEWSRNCDHCKALSQALSEESTSLLSYPKEPEPKD